MIFTITGVLLPRNTRGDVVRGFHYISSIWIAYDGSREGYLCEKEEQLKTVSDL